MDKLKSEYFDIAKKLDDLCELGQLSEYDKATIIEMSKKVLESIACKYQNIQKGVTDAMGGKILEYEAKTILQQGISEAKQEITKNLLKKNFPYKDIADVTGLTVEQIKEIEKSSL